MMPRKKRRVILISVIVVILIIISAILIVLYATTDMFKSNDVLFNKYASQLIDNMKIMFNEDNMSEMEDILSRNKLSSTSTAQIEYSENGNTDNPINNIQININGQDEESTGYKYRDFQIVQNEDILLGAEYIEEDNIAGVRLNGIRQFLSTNAPNEGNSELNIINRLLNTDIQEMLGLNSEEIETLKNKYIGILVNNISVESYSKQKGVALEINGAQYNTNVYTITITKEQFNNIYIQILEEMQKDEIILSKIENVDNKINAYYSLTQSWETSNLKQQFIDKIAETIQEIKNTNIGNDQRTISVFETNGTAISFSIDTEEYFAGVDIVNTNENNFINILGNEKIEEDEKENSFDLKIQKTPLQNDETITINYDVVEEGEKTTNEFTVNRKMESTKVNNNINISRSVAENNIDISIENVIDIVNDFEEKEELTEENNVILENLNDEQKQSVTNNIRQNITEQLNRFQEVVPTERIEDMLVSLKLMKEKAETISNEGITEAERTRFNSDFELYVGEDVEKERLKELMNVVKGNLKEIRISEYEEENSYSDEKVPLEYRLGIERGTDNSELAERFIAYMEENLNQNCTVRLEYDETTGLVNNVYIRKNTD